MLDKCIHTRNLVPFYNSGEDAKKYSFIANHMKDCDQCKESYHELKQKNHTLGELVPSVSISKEMQKSFESEIKTLINKAIKYDKEAESMSFIPTVIRNQVRDIVATFTSRTMVRAYFFFAIYFVIVKSFGIGS